MGTMASRRTNSAEGSTCSYFSMASDVIGVTGGGVWAVARAAKRAQIAPEWAKRVGVFMGREGMSRLTAVQVKRAEAFPAQRCRMCAHFSSFGSESEFMSKIYVGNLPFSADEAQVRALFEPHGAVESVSLINDRETGRPRGFGFVEMSREDAAKAIQALNGKDMGGRPLKVNEAQDKPRGGGGGGGGGG